MDGLCAEYLKAHLEIIIEFFVTDKAVVAAGTKVIGILAAFCLPRIGQMDSATVSNF